MRLPLVLVLFAGCAAPPASLTVSPSEVKLGAKGATQALTAVAQDQYGKDTPAEGLAWTSGDPAIATVDATGLVTAVSSGRTTATAAIGEKPTSSAQIEVDIFATGSTNAPAFLAPGESWTLTFDLKNDKGERYAGSTATCVSDQPAVADVVDGKIVAGGGGVAKITCKVGESAFDASVAVVSAELAELAKTEGEIAADYKWVRESIALAAEVKAAGVDNIKLTRFAVRRGKVPFSYTFCGSKAEIKMTLQGGVPIVITGPCAASFPAETPPWTGTPWMPILAAYQAKGGAVAADENIEVTAAKPDTWTMRGGGATHAVIQGGVVQP